jgi:hypothetical protein
MDVSWDGRTRSIFIQGGPMSRYPADSSDKGGIDGTDFSTPGFLANQYQYGIDYAKHLICFKPMPYDREFLFSFSFYNASNIIETHVDELIAVPANTNAWITIPNIPNGSGAIVPDSDTAGRKFKEVAPGTWSTNNPYEFYVASPTIGNLGNVGVIIFNPMGREFTEQTNVGPQPLTAHIDYDVLDWHIIREDRSMPGSRPYVLPLSLKGIKRVGDTESDQTDYEGLFTGIPKANNVGDILIYDMTSGNVVPEFDSNNVRNYYVNFKEGIVTFGDAFGDANRAGTFRFFYKAHGDWALIVQKAAGIYNRVNTAALGYASYWLGDTSNGSFATRVYFPRSEAGKTITVREIWYLDANNVVHKLTNKTYRIESNPSAFQSIGPYQLTYLDIATEFDPADPAKPVAFDYKSTGQPLIGVQGVSLRARVLWRNTSSVSQSGGENVFAGRWRKVDIDTILARAPGQ